MPVLFDIHVKDAFWFRAVEQLLSFRYHELPNDVHFSLSLDERSDEVNLHVTRNTKHPDDKPKIEIARMLKKDLDELAPDLWQAIFGVMLKPIRLRSGTCKCRRFRSRISFFPFPNRGEQNLDPFQHLLLNAFRPLTKVKGKKVKVNGEWPTQLETLTARKNVQDAFYKRFEPLPLTFPERVTGGIIISRNFKGCAAHIDHQWYAFREGISMLELLSACMDAALAEQLIDNAALAIDLVSQATSYAQTSQYDLSTYLYPIPTENA